MNARRYLRAAPFRRGRLATARMRGEPANRDRAAGQYVHMRRAHVGAILAACLWMTTDASGVTVHANEASAVAGARYVTFFVLQGNSSGSMTVDRQLRTDIETALTDKGFVEASSEEAQAVVIVHTASPAKHSRDAFYKGWGGWDWRLADTRAPAGTEDYKVGTVVVDVFDAWTKKLLWHGFAPTAR
jgi:hypothetical protein